MIAVIALAIVCIALIVLLADQQRQWVRERTEMINRMQARSISELAQLTNITTPKAKKEREQDEAIPPTVPIF